MDLPSISPQYKTPEGKLNTVLYRQLLKDEDDPNLFENIRMYDPKYTKITQDAAIKCVRIHQSNSTTRQAYHIATVFWDTTKWVKYSDYQYLSGGGKFPECLVEL